jgi:hypothetical protein
LGWSAKSGWWVVVGGGQCQGHLILDLSSPPYALGIEKLLAHTSQVVLKTRSSRPSRSQSIPTCIITSTSRIIYELTMTEIMDEL